MSPRRVITVATLLWFLVGLLSPAQAARSSRVARACCVRYSRRPVPFELIRGYREQTDLDSCRIEAIIFYTTQKTEVCASKQDDWVKRLLKQLSAKLQKMSKPGEGRPKKSVSPDGSGLLTPADTALSTT